MVFRTLWFLRSNYDSYNRPPACLPPTPSPLSLSRYCFYSPVGSLHVRGEVREGVGSAPCAIAMARRSLNKAHLLPLHVARCLLSICNGGCHFSSIADPTLCHYPLPLASLLLPRLLPLRVFKLLLLNFLYARFYFCFCFFSLVCNNCCIDVA